MTAYIGKLVMFSFTCARSDTEQGVAQRAFLDLCKLTGVSAQLTFAGVNSKKGELELVSPCNAYPHRDKPECSEWSLLLLLRLDPRERNKTTPPVKIKQSRFHATHDTVNRKVERWRLEQEMQINDRINCFFCFFL